MRGPAAATAAGEVAEVGADLLPALEQDLVEQYALDVLMSGQQFGQRGLVTLHPGVENILVNGHSVRLARYEHFSG